MICQFCGKREGTLKLLIKDNVKQKVCICRECEARSFVSVREEPEIRDPIQAVIDAFSGFDPFQQYVFEQAGLAPTKCPDCGWSSEDFERTQLVGCPKCYETFAPTMKKVIAEYQQKSMHVGKAPSGCSPVSFEYEHLRRELEKAVSEERYEDAASLKKLIGGLQNK